MKYLIGLVLIAGICLILLSGCASTVITTSNTKYTISGIAPVMGDVPSVDFKLAAPLPDLPDKLPVYKMIKPEITEDYVKALAAKFGLLGDISEGTWNYLVSDNLTRTYLEVYKASGTIRYYRLSYFEMRSESIAKNPPVLPSEEEALKIATDYLVERDLMPKGDVAYKVEVGERHIVPLHLLVSFRHAFQLIGPGAVHGVRIGDGGEVVEVFINPTNPLVLPSLEEAAAKPVRQVYQEMQTAKHYSASSQCRKAIIDNVSVAYWIESENIGQDYMAPVYVFRGTCWDADGKQLSVPFFDVKEALK
jgi:hypothetical protein